MKVKMMQIKIISETHIFSGPTFLHNNQDNWPLIHNDNIASVPKEWPCNDLHCISYAECPTKFMQAAIQDIIFAKYSGRLSIPIDVSQSARHTFEIPLLNLNFVHLSPKLCWKQLHCFLNKLVVEFWCYVVLDVIRMWMFDDFHKVDG